MSTDFTEEYPAMWVLPWEQYDDGFIRYRWRHEMPLGRSTVIRGVDTRKRAIVDHKMFHHYGPVAGLFVVWDREQMPTIEDMGRMMPMQDKEDW